MRSTTLPVFSQSAKLILLSMLNSLAKSFSVNSINTFITSVSRLHFVCDAFAILRCTVIDTDDPEKWNNAPTALQLVGRTLEEEAVIAMTEVVDRALKASSN